jgi:hypothetical protein
MQKRPFTLSLGWMAQVISLARLDLSPDGLPARQARTPPNAAAESSQFFVSALYLGSFPGIENRRFDMWFRILCLDEKHCRTT